MGRTNKESLWVFVPNTPAFGGGAPLRVNAALARTCPGPSLYALELFGRVQIQENFLATNPKLPEANNAGEWISGLC